MSRFWRWLEETMWPQIAVERLYAEKAVQKAQAEQAKEYSFSGMQNPGSGSLLAMKCIICPHCGKMLGIPND